ncbi:acetate kinase [Candidatus Sumerlaeota bacterium]|nr:acetate kinase [Candidatus Sumerlaeota bacterium]
MKVLVLNCGSSSVKFQLIETSLEAIKNDTEERLAKGIIERIGMPASIIKFESRDNQPYRATAEILEHRVAINKVVQLLTDPDYGVIKHKEEIGAVGHRVVHGGERFSTSKIIDPDVYKEMIECIELAPLHNPHNIKGYEIAREILPNVPHVAVFDTSFHQSMPAYAYIYGLPYVLYERHAIRRYGFHGTSHRYLTFRVERITGIPRNQFKLITCHLGNGCSIAAVKFGKSIDTSMGFTPLEGLVMGTRCGDIDPAIVLHVMAKEELELHEINTLLNKHSGLYGISGVSNDMREVIKSADKGNERAQLALDIFCYRLKKYIAAYAGAMGGTDYIAFTAGIGENSPVVRQKSCEGLEFMGIKIDQERNNQTVGKEALISTDDSPVKVFVIPTNEELVIARDTVRCINGVI